MKTIAFFSEKGGVGKSSFTIMYASWLHYKYGVKVAVADFNQRISAYRKSEQEERLKLCKKNPGLKPFEDKNTWPIENVSYAVIRQYKSEGYATPYGFWFEAMYTRGSLRGYDVILCDFPGSMTGNEFQDVCSMKLLNLVIIPTEKDEMTLDSTFWLHTLLKSANKCNYCAFINKARTNLNNQRATYHGLAEILIKRGLPLLPDMVSNSDRMMSIDKVDNIRSTYGFPDFSRDEYGPNRDLGVENLFIDVTRELDKTKDLRDTGTADLSFVRSLKKTDDGRQLRGTPFKEYEI